jgi:hypothetical protein
MRSDLNLSTAFERLDRAQRDLEDATIGAFIAFESCHALVAQALEVWVGDRRKAAHWMTFHRCIFHGKSGYELVMEGDIETLWEHIEGYGAPHLELLRDSGQDLNEE